jgi:hypothetical protein
LIIRGFDADKRGRALNLLAYKVYEGIAGEEKRIDFSDIMV